MAIPRGRDWLHISIAALFLSVSFGVAGTFAQLMANTSRVIIVNYSMPVWGSLMAYVVLRERINARAALGLPADLSADDQRAVFARIDAFLQSKATVIPVCWVADARLVSPRLEGWREDVLGDVDYAAIG